MNRFESQHTEWKESWRDDLLRWVCGFANAEGGRLEIGRNDKGEIVGLANASKLLEDLPNKIRDLLGILVAVNLHHADGKAWLAIEVDAYQGIQRIERYPVPDVALREAILNALVHRDYAVGAPVQIRVYEDRLKIWNPAVLPEGWTLENLLADHASTPYNPALFSITAS
ncbi:MAG: putative DNA binding domain-containing protein [Verrucomicrobia bacterium]|nr:putative DNA binding domain-containing protein [Verrucomicrobiota bacterium]